MFQTWFDFIGTEQMIDMVCAVGASSLCGVIPLFVLNCFFKGIAAMPCAAGNVFLFIQEYQVRGC